MHRVGGVTTLIEIVHFRIAPRNIVVVQGKAVIVFALRNIDFR
jgi:hypothetical protein